MQTHEQVPAHVENEIIPRHAVLTENPYTTWFAETKEGPSTAQVKDLVIQMSVLSQESVIMRRKRQSGAAKAEHHPTDEMFVKWLHEVADALPIDPEKDLRGRALGSVELATRETRHALHQLERTYGSANGRISAGASFALGLWAGYGIVGGSHFPRVSFLTQIRAGILHHNTVRRRPLGIPEIPTVAFFGDLFFPEQVNADRVVRRLSEFREPGSALTDWWLGANRTEWFFGQKHALDALYVFWFGLDKRKFTLT